MLEIKELQEIITAVCFLLLLVIAYLVFKKFTTKENCPHCSNKRDLERIRKVEILKHIPFTNLKHFKCYKCNKTHYHVQFKTYSIFVNNRIL
jgi:hypothetical protein